MRALLSLLAMVIMVPSISLAADSGQTHRFEILGYYGMGFATTTDLNTASAFNFPAAGLKNISSETLYGGELGFRLAGRLRLLLGLDALSANNVSGASGYTFNNT